MDLSIVTTLYQSEGYVTEFCDRVTAAARLLTSDFEIVLVNDGSPDGSLRVAREYAARHPGIRVVDLSRNFGHQKAIMTGLAHARGDRVFLIDSDLEEEPEWLLTFWKMLEGGSADVVYGIQARRRGGPVDRVTGRLYYLVYRALTGLAIPDNLVTARLMTRRYVKALLGFEERELDIAGLWAVTGFEQQSCPVEKRSSSKSTYRLSHKMNVLIDSITSFSNAPLVGIFYFGLFLSMSSAVFVVYLLVRWAFFDRPLSGWTSVMGSIWLLGGLIISFIGVIGIYLSKVFSEAKRRPYTIVREVYSSPTAQGAVVAEKVDAERLP